MENILPSTPPDTSHCRLASMYSLLEGHPSRIKFESKDKRVVLLITFFWLISRIWHFFDFKLHLATDSLTYLELADEFVFSSENNTELSRSILYVALLHLLGEKTIGMVFLQSLISLFSAIIIYFLGKHLSFTRKSATTISLIFLFFPLTAYFEAHILTESIASFLILLLIYIWFTFENRKTKYSFAIVLLLSCFISLQRPNFIVFLLTLVLTVLMFEKKSEYRKIFAVAALTGIFTSLVFTYLLTGNLKTGQQTLKVGIAMHLVDTFPTQIANSEIAREISKYENVLKRSVPSNRFWAVQHGLVQYNKENPELDADVTSDQFWTLTKKLLKEYPFTYFKSVFTSFITLSVDDVTAFRPGSDFYDFPKFISMISGVIVSSFVFYVAILHNLLLGFLNRQYRVLLFSDRVLTIAVPVFCTLVINAIVSPIEQSRYMFPLLSLLLLISARVLQINKEK